MTPKNPLHSFTTILALTVLVCLADGAPPCKMDCPPANGNETNTIGNSTSEGLALNSTLEQGQLTQKEDAVYDVLKSKPGGIVKTILLSILLLGFVCSMSYYIKTKFVSRDRLITFMVGYTQNQMINEVMRERGELDPSRGMGGRGPVPEPGQPVVNIIFCENIGGQGLPPGQHTYYLTKQGGKIGKNKIEDMPPPSYESLGPPNYTPKI